MESAYSQAEYTLNMLRPTRINLKISAFAFMEGNHVYDAVPFAPPGWKVLVFEDPQRRGSWYPHGVEGIYVAAAMEHYQNYHCYIPTTIAVRTTNTMAFFKPKHYQLVQQPTPEETMIDVTRELGAAIKRVAKKSSISKFGTIPTITTNYRHDKGENSPVIHE